MENQRAFEPETEDPTCRLGDRCGLRDETIAKLDPAGQPSESSNNNDHHFKCLNANTFADQQASMGSLGRSSGQSNSPSFNDRDHHHSSPSSSPESSLAGSSAHGEPTPESPEHPSAANNLAPNVTPETREARELVELVRTKLLANLQGSNANLEQYDELDLEELEKKLPQVGECEQSLSFRLIRQFLDFHLLLASGDAKLRNESTSEAVDKLDSLLKFRQHHRLSRVMSDQFSKEFFLLSEMFQFGRDRQNLPLLYIRARVHRRWPGKLNESFQRYFAWQVNEITKCHRDAKVASSIDLEGNVKDGSFALCYDSYGISYSCVDLDFFRFLVRLLVDYYPTYCRYTLCLDIPLLFRSVWKVVQTWLPEEAKSRVHLIASKELVEFVDEDQIPNSIRFNDMEASAKPAENKHKMPKNYESLREIDALAEDLELSKSELEQFKAHVDKIRKSYEQLGAI